MLHRLTIHNSSSQELRQRADERRVLAAAKEHKLKALLLQEARLLEHYAELLDWLQSPGDDGSRQRLSDVGIRGVVSKDPFHSSGAASSGAESSTGTRSSGARSFRNLSSGTLAGFSPQVRHGIARLALGLADQQALLAVAARRHVLKGEYLTEEGDTHPGLIILCSGMVRTVRALADGGQQVTAIFVAGDMINAGDLAFSYSKMSIEAVTPAFSLSIPLSALRTLMDERPAIVRALWRETAAHAAIQQEWMIGLGRRSAQARMAHFLCEMACRLQLFNPQGGDGFDLPMTQQELSDVLGLSAVHVNRVLQALRNEGLIEFDRGRLEILNKAGLYAVAEFDAHYLTGLMRPEAGSN
jgi:CRP-like cAMP-binding protein